MKLKRSKILIALIHSGDICYFGGKYEPGAWHIPVTADVIEIMLIGKHLALDFAALSFNTLSLKWGMALTIYWGDDSKCDAMRGIC